MSQLQRFSISNFRNVKNATFGVGANNVVISGPNMMGKTNTLSAIHWAFTGKAIDGSADNRENMTIASKAEVQPAISVKLEFDDFTFERRCELVDGKPTVTILFDGEETKTIKNGEARLYAKLGLSDIVLNQKGTFDIVRFLLNPLYFDSLAPKDLRRFFYDLAELDFTAIANQQSMAVFNVVNGQDKKDPYELAAAVAKEKKAEKAKLEACKAARTYFQSIKEEAEQLEKETTKKLKEIESKEALIDKFAVAVSKRANAFFKKAMGITVCLLEEGVGDDVFKDVCYPILPFSKLPFAQGSYAERTYVGVKFIQEVCLRFNIKPLPILVDNMESLDHKTRAALDELNVQYIGAEVAH